MIKDREYYLRFPVVLREALQNELVHFPETVQTDFEDFKAYRAASIKNAEQIEYKHFLSQAELVKQGKVIKGFKEDDIGYYSCSLSSTIKHLEKCMRLPRANIKIIKGLIKKDDGIIEVSKKDDHIHLWLYDKENFDDFIQRFKIIEE